MSAGRSISGFLAVLFSSDFKICVHFQENTAEASILNTSFHILLHTRKVSSILSPQIYSLLRYTSCERRDRIMLFFGHIPYLTENTVSVMQTNYGETYVDIHITCLFSWSSLIKIWICQQMFSKSSQIRNFVKIRVVIAVVYSGWEHNEANNRFM